MSNPSTPGVAASWCRRHDPRSHPVRPGSAEAQPGSAKPASAAAIKPGTHTTFPALKQINAGLLNVGYAEAGPADGPPVILLHGWPYDIYSFVDVAPLLASAGYRVIVPYVRGYGTTRFLSSDTLRNGQPGALAMDIIALMDALGIDKAVIAGSIGARGPPPSWPRCGRTLQGAGIGERLPDRQPGIRQDAVASSGGATMVVPILLCHRTRSGRLRQIPPRIFQTDLATRLAEVEFRRRHVRSLCRGVRQLRPR